MATGNCTILGHRKSDGTLDTKNAAYVGYGSSTTYYPYWLKFTAPTFSGQCSSITFNLSMLHGYRNGTKASSVNLRWALCSSDANYASYKTYNTVSDPNQIVSGVVTYDGLTSSYQTKTLTISTTGLKSGVTYFLVLWGNNSGGFTGDTATMNASTGHSAVLTYVNTYKLTISQGTGSTITVKKGSTTLTNGATVTYGDVLTISFRASTGYNLGTHTVNGSTFTSGGTHTVTGAVSVVSTATKKTFTLSISQGTGSTISVKRSGTALSNGATITYGDVLTITFSASTGYNLGTHTVNGTSFTSGNTHTVTAAVSVVSTASVKSFTLSISAGTGSSITVNRTSSPKKGASTGNLSNGATIYYSDVLNITFSASSSYELATHTVNGSSFTSGDSHTVTSAVSVISTATLNSFTLSISQDVGSTVTVKRDGVTLSDGAEIVYGDPLVVTFVAKTGYYLTSTSHLSGSKITVTGDVEVSATSSVLAFILSISADTGSTITINRTSSPKASASIGELNNGATVYYSDVLELTFSSKKGYQLLDCTVNNSPFVSGNSHTVVSAVNIALLTRVLAHAIGGSDSLYATAIKDGDSFKIYVASVYTKNGWKLCGQ